MRKNVVLILSLMLCFITLNAQWTDYGSFIGPTSVNHVYIDGLDGQNLYFENNGSFIASADSRGLAWSLDSGNSGGDNNIGTVLMTQYYDYINNKLHFDTDFSSTDGYIMTLVPSSGRVGIGVDAPEERLHVAGKIEVEEEFPFVILNSTNSGNAGLTFEDNGLYQGAFFLDRSANAFVLQRGIATIGYYSFSMDRATGNIGINGGLAEHKLDVAGDRIRLRESDTAGAKEIVMATDLSNGVDLQASNANLKLSRWNGMSYDGEIDMTSTDIRIESYNNDVNIYAYNSGTGTDGDVRLRATDDVSISTDVGDVYIDADNAGSVDGDVLIYGDDDVIIYNNGTSTLLATNDNLVGIGVNAPAEKLDVDGAVRLGTTATANEGTVRYTGLDFEGYTASGWKSLTSGTGGSVWSQNGASIYFNTGNVGIGTTTPAFDLQVVGDVDVTGELTAASDLRFKKNIEPLEDALDLIAQLNPVCYDYRVDEFPSKKFAERRKIGLIAQEVEQVLPNLVSESGPAVKANGETLDTKSVNYMEMVPVLIKAVQELREEVKQKDAQLERMDALEKEMAVLKALLQQKK